MPSCLWLLLFFVLFCSACRVCPPCFVRHPIQVGATKVNSGSSRSHLVCMVGGAYVCLNRLGTSVNILVISFPLVETETSPSPLLSLFSARMVGPLLLCTWLRHPNRSRGGVKKHTGPVLGRIRTRLPPSGLPSPSITCGQTRDGGVRRRHLLMHKEAYSM